MKPRHDIYATVTDQLVAAIEAGAGNWRMPWLGHLASVSLRGDGTCAGRA